MTLKEANYEVERLNNKLNKLLKDKELLKIYHSLIIYTDKPTINIYKRENEKIDCVVEIYDDFVE